MHANILLLTMISKPRYENREKRVVKITWLCKEIDHH